MANILAYRFPKRMLHFQEISDEDWRRLGLRLDAWDMLETEDQVAIETAQFIEATDEGKAVVDEYGPIIELFAFQDHHPSGEQHCFYNSPPSLRQTDYMIRFAVVFDPMSAFRLEDLLLEKIGPEMRRIIEKRRQGEEFEEGESG